MTSDRNDACCEGLGEQEQVVREALVTPQHVSESGQSVGGSQVVSGRPLRSRMSKGPVAGEHRKGQDTGGLSRVATAARISRPPAEHAGLALRGLGSRCRVLSRGGPWRQYFQGISLGPGWRQESWEELSGEGVARERGCGGSGGRGQVVALGPVCRVRIGWWFMWDVGTGDTPGI